MNAAGWIAAVGLGGLAVLAGSTMIRIVPADAPVTTVMTAPAEGLPPSNASSEMVTPSPEASTARSGSGQGSAASSASHVPYAPALQHRRPAAQSASAWHSSTASSVRRSSRRHTPSSSSQLRPREHGARGAEQQAPSGPPQS